jgi:hypothetical protein
MDQTSWEAAENTIREWIKASKIGGDVVPLKTIEEAVDLYLKDMPARVRASTVRLHRVVLKDSLLPWCEDQGFRYVKQLDVAAMIDFRASWTYAPLTALKKFARLRSTRVWLVLLSRRRAAAAGPTARVGSGNKQLE